MPALYASTFLALSFLLISSCSAVVLTFILPCWKQIGNNYNLEMRYLALVNPFAARGAELCHSHNIQSNKKIHVKRCNESTIYKSYFLPSTPQTKDSSSFICNASINLPPMDTYSWCVLYRSNETLHCVRVRQPYYERKTYYAQLR